MTSQEERPVGSENAYEVRPRPVSRLLAWCSGASIGLAVGLLYGTLARDHWPRGRSHT